MSAFLIGQWIGGLLAAIFFGSICLYFAGRPSMRPGTASTLRALAVALCVLMVYAGWLGSGKTFVNLGSIAGLVLVGVSAMRQKRQQAVAD